MFEVLIVCRIVIRSCGVASSVLRVLIMFDSSGVFGIWIRMLGCWLIWMLVCSVIMVWLFENGLGWLIMGCELMVIDRLLCAMVQGFSVIVWLSIIEFVRVLSIMCVVGIGCLSVSFLSCVMKFMWVLVSTGVCICMVWLFSVCVILLLSWVLMVCATCCAVSKLVLLSLRLMLSFLFSVVGIVRLIWVLLGMWFVLSWLIWILLLVVEVFVLLIIRLFWVSA